MTPLKQTLRQLRQRPAASGLSVGLLALGIGLSVAFYSVLDTALLSGLPFPGGDRMMAFSTADAAGWPMPLEDFRDIESAQRAFDWVMPLRTFNTTITRGDRTRGLIGSYVPPALFERLGVEPVLGRGFTTADEDPAAVPVALISHRLWHGTYGADPAILGEEITLNRERCVVVGVMPPGFRFPLRHDVWGVFGRPNRQWSDSPVFGIALRAHGTTPPEAAADLSRIVALLDAERALPDGRTAALESFVRANIGDRTHGALRAMVFAALGLLALTCANLANLRLAESLRRVPELATRLALGSGLWGLIRMLVLENLVLGATAAILGLGFGFVLIETLGQSLLSGARLERIFWIDAALDWRAAAFAMLCALVATCLGALAPILSTAWRLRAGRLVGGNVSRRYSAVPARGLVSLQVGLCFALLVGAGLWGSRANELLAAVPGFDIDHLSSVRISAYQAELDDNEARVALFERLRRELDAHPDVEATAHASSAPWGYVPSWPVGSGAHGPDRDSAPKTKVLTVSAGFSTTLGLDLLAGRGFTASETAAGANHQVAMVSRTLAERLFGDHAIGRTITLGARRASESVRRLRVVGVVADLHLDRDDIEDRNLAVYLPATTAGDGAFLLVRRRPGAAPGRELVEAVLERVAPLVGTLDELTVEQALASSIWVERRLGQIFSLFALAALVVTAGGIYAVIALMVRSRERELGIRAAIGARPRDLQRLVVAESGRQLLIGLVVGGGALWFGERLLEELLVDGVRVQPVVLAAAALVVTLGGLIGSWVPARRAARADPTRCLSAE